MNSWNFISACSIIIEIRDDSFLLFLFVHRSSILVSFKYLIERIFIVVFLILVWRWIVMRLCILIGIVGLIFGLIGTITRVCFGLVVVIWCCFKQIELKPEQGQKNVCLHSLIEIEIYIFKSSSSSYINRYSQQIPKPILHESPARNNGRPARIRYSQSNPSESESIESSTRFTYSL